MFIRGKVWIAHRQGPDGEWGYGEIDEKDLTPETDAIAIRERMSFGTRQRVADKMMELSNWNTPGIGAYNLVLMWHNILEWRGPSFRGVSLSPEAIEQLDQDEPLVDAVMEALAKRNPIRRRSEEKAEKKGSGSDGSASTEEGFEESPQESTISTASSQRPTDGSLTKSTGRTRKSSTK